MRSMPFKLAWPVFSAALLLGAAADRHAFSAEDTAPAQIVKQPAGAQIVPDKDLRRWDPVTIFFDRNVGPANGGAEHGPENYVPVTPAHPGAFTWLNARTLQFRPAEAWPALGRYEWKVGDKGTVLASLMDAPTATIPANGAANLDPVDSVTLTFAQPVDPKVLAQMLDIEIAPLPGLDRSKAKRIDPNDFTIKTVERGSRSDAASYVIAFRQPIPAGMRATVPLGLSAEPELDATVQRIGFTTSEIFQPLFLGCAEKRVPVSGEGNTYGKNAALSCKTETEQIAGANAGHRHRSSEDTEASSEGQENQGQESQGQESQGQDNQGQDSQDGNAEAEGEGEGGNQQGMNQDSDSDDNTDDQQDNGAADAGGKRQPVVDSHPLKE